MSRAWSRLLPALGGGRAATGIQVTERFLRAVACDAAGRVLVRAESALDAGDAAGWRTAFRRLRAEAPGLGQAAVCCGPSGWTDALPLRLPSGGDLESLIVDRARAQLSYPVEDAVLDYLGPEPRGDGTRRALLYALPRPRALQLLEAAAAGRFEVVAVESPGIALQRALRHAGRLDARHSLLVRIEADHVLFLVLDAENLHVERGLGWGLCRLESAVAEQLELPQATAARLLHGAGDGVGELQAELGSALHEIVAPAVRELVVEVERVLGFCRAEFRESGVERLLLSGAAARVPSLRAALRDFSPAAEDAWPGGPGTPPGDDDRVAHGLALRLWERV